MVIPFKLFCENKITKSGRYESSFRSLKNVHASNVTSITVDTDDGQYVVAARYRPNIYPSDEFVIVDGPHLNDPPGRFSASSLYNLICNILRFHITTITVNVELKEYNL
jgi:hypothetical protein